MTLQTHEPDFDAVMLAQYADPLFGDLTDGVLIHQHGRIAYANRQLGLLLGFDPGELRGRPALSLYSDNDYEVAVARWQRAAFSPRPTAVTSHRLLRQNGESVGVAVTSLLLPLQDGEALVIEILRRAPGFASGGDDSRHDA